MPRIYTHFLQAFGVLLLALLFLSPAHARGEFEKVGDVLTLAPVGVLIVSLGMQDYEGAAQLVAGSLVTQGVIEMVKKSFQFAHDRGGLH